MAPLRFAVLPGRYAVVRLAPDAGLPPGALAPPFGSATRTPSELSFVCPEEGVPDGARAERGWALIGLVGPFPFDMVGVLSSVLAPLAAAGVSIFALSTFDTDHVLVKSERLEAAVDALVAAGHERVEPATPAARGPAPATRRRASATGAVSRGGARPRASSARPSARRGT